MTIDRNQILDASKLKLGVNRTRSTALRRWLDEAMSLLAPQEALAIPLFDGLTLKQTIARLRSCQSRLGRVARAQFHVRTSEDGSAAYLIRRPGPSKGGKGKP